MPLFGKRKAVSPSEDDLRSLEHSVTIIRRRLVNQKMPLNDLFALMKEDERPILAHLPKKRPEDEEASLEAQVAQKPAIQNARNQQLDTRSNELFFSSR